MSRKPDLRLSPTWWTRPTEFELVGDRSDLTDVRIVWPETDRGMTVDPGETGRGSWYRHGVLLDAFVALARPLGMARLIDACLDIVSTWGAWTYCACGKAHRPPESAPHISGFAVRELATGYQRGDPIAGRRTTSQPLSELVLSANRVNAFRQLVALVSGAAPSSDVLVRARRLVWPDRAGWDGGESADLAEVISGWMRGAHIQPWSTAEHDQPEAHLMVGGLAAGVLWALFEEFHLQPDLRIGVCRQCAVTWRIQRVRNDKGARGEVWCKRCQRTRPWEKEEASG